VTGGQDGGLLFYAGPLRRNYSVLDFDRKLNYQQTLTYELPAGRGHAHFNQGPLMYALGGWRVAIILSDVSGLPFTITTSSATSGTTQTANQIGPYQVTHSTAGGKNSAPTWFNPASFSNAASSFTTPGLAPCPVTYVGPCAVGNTQRNQFRGPADFSDNISLFKSFPIFREAALETRFDAFNATNTPQFANPSGSLGSNLGKITSTLGSGVGNVNGVGGPRVLQAAVMVTF
jgi:hypothetical protein